MRGTMVTFPNDKQVWVQFKYEGLPNYCFYSGKLGHVRNMGIQGRLCIMRGWRLVQIYGGMLSVHRRVKLSSKLRGEGYGRTVGSRGDGNGGLVEQRGKGVRSQVGVHEVGGWDLGG